MAGKSLLLAMLLTGSSVEAQTLDEATAHFYAQRWSEALEAVAQVLSKVDAATPSGESWKTKRAALVLRAMVERAQGRKAFAAESLRAVLRVDATHRLDPDVYTPTTVAQFEATRKELARTRKGSLRIENQGAPGEVFVDGAPQGSSPATLALVPGSYRVQLSAPGLPLREANVVVGASTVHVFEPAPAASTPVATAVPAGHRLEPALIASVASDAVQPLRGAGPRVVSVVLAGAAVAAGVAAGILAASAGGHERTVAGATSSEGFLPAPGPQRDAALLAMSSAQTERTASLGLAVGAGASLAVSGLLFFLLPPSDDAQAMGK